MPACAPRINIYIPRSHLGLPQSAKLPGGAGRLPHRPSLYQPPVRVPRPRLHAISLTNQPGPGKKLFVLLCLLLLGLGSPGRGVAGAVAAVGRLEAPGDKVVTAVVTMELTGLHRPQGGRTGVALQSTLYTNTNRVALYFSNHWKCSLSRFSWFVIFDSELTSIVEALCCGGGPGSPSSPDQVERASFSATMLRTTLWPRNLTRQVGQERT